MALHKNMPQFLKLDLASREKRSEQAETGVAACKICDRQQTAIFCRNCKKLHFGRIQRSCADHPNVTYLYDMNECSCGAEKANMFETDMPKIIVDQLNEARRRTAETYSNARRN